MDKDMETLAGIGTLISIAVAFGPITVGIAAYYIGKMVERLSNND